MLLLPYSTQGLPWAVHATQEWDIWYHLTPHFPLQPTMNPFLDFLIQRRNFPSSFEASKEIYFLITLLKHQKCRDVLAALAPSRMRRKRGGICTPTNGCIHHPCTNVSNTNLLHTELDRKTISENY